MAANSLLKQYSDERAALVQGAVSKAAAIILGRRRVLSGIRWRDDLIVTAAEAIGGAEQVDIQLEGDELEARVIATDLTTDIAILRVPSATAGHAAAGSQSAIAATAGTAGHSETAAGPDTAGHPAATATGTAGHTATT